MQITPANVDALLDAGRLQINMLSDDWFTVRRFGRTERKSGTLFIPYLVAGPAFRSFGCITEFEFETHGGILPRSYYRVRMDS